MLDFIGCSFFGWQEKDFKSNGFFVGCLIFSIALTFGYMVQLQLYRSELKAYREREAHKEPEDSETWIKKAWDAMKDKLKPRKEKGTGGKKSDADGHSWFRTPWNKIAQLANKPKTDAELEYDAGSLPLDDGKDGADLDKWYFDEKLNKYWKVVERKAAKSRFTDLLSDNGDVESDKALDSHNIQAIPDFREMAGTDLTAINCSKEMYYTAIASFVGTTSVILGYMLMSHFSPETTNQIKTIFVDRYEQLKNEAVRLLNL
jgi:hypothetical protein